MKYPGTSLIAALVLAVSAAAPAWADPPPPPTAPAAGAVPPAPPAPAEERNSWLPWNWGAMFRIRGLGGVDYGSGANRIEGSDKLVHQLRTIAGVRAIELRGPVDMVIKQGQVEKLTLHTDDNVAPLIETKVEDGVLRIGVQPGASFRTRHPIGATVEINRLNSVKVFGSGDVVCAQLDTDLMEVTVQGSGDVRMDSLKAGALAVLIQGSGDVHLSGNVPKQGYVIEGSGDVTATELAGKEVAVRVAGSGDASVWAMDSLSVEIAGSGDVVYHGRPVVHKQVHGSGDVTHRD